MEPLGQPRRTVPAPDSAFVKEWARKRDLRLEVTTTESYDAELYAFENAKSTKKLEVFMWTIKHFEAMFDWREVISLHYAFLLQVVDM